jgi:hypothetical protein
MMEEFDLLDIKSESEPLSDAELVRLKEINLEMQKLWLKEETKAKQRSRDRDILEGDRNTAYFHAVANKRRRKTLISSLEGPEGQSSDLPEMLDIASDYYKNLFHFEEGSGFALDSDFFSPDEKVSPDQNLGLESPFIEQEVKKAVFDSYSDGAPGPDGISFMFYQTFWELVKADVMDMFTDFFEGKLDIFRLICHLVSYS